MAEIQFTTSEINRSNDHSKSKLKTNSKPNKRGKSPSNRKKMPYSSPEANLRRLVAAKKNRINFISGTVSPAPSAKHKAQEHKAQERRFESFEPSDLEDLEIGLDYLCKSYNYKTVISVQPKYMGSRFNLYLFNEDTVEGSCNTSYGVTRNGFLVKPKNETDTDSRASLSRTDFNNIVTDIYSRMKSWMDEHDVRMMIIDGELMPWSVLGKSLIDQHFKSVDAGLIMESHCMQEYSFDSAMAKILDRFEGINKFYPELTKNDRVLVYGEALTKDYERFQEIYRFPNADKMREYSDKYHRQMQLYGRHVTDTSNSRVEFKPFSILKLCFKDKSESIPLLDRSYSQGEMFDLLNQGMNSNHLLIKINSASDIPIAKVRLRSFFNRLTVDEGCEGVVLKPAYVEQKQIPMVKVRNPDYLTIIYGYDFQDEPKLRRLVMSKSTSSKIRHSIQEFQIGMEMLIIPYDEIPTSKEYDSIFMRMINKENMGKTLDPKL